MESLIDKMKPLQYFYNLLQLKNNSGKIHESEKSIEEQMFELEQELDIPTNLRYYKNERNNN